MQKDLQEYVQQLEEFADKKIVELSRKAEQLEAERDALLLAVKKFASCTYCKNLISHGGDCPGGRRCKLFRNTGFEFEWRGVQKEEAN